MDAVAVLALQRRDRIVQVSDTARVRALRLWRQMDFRNLDGSWGTIVPAITQQVSSAQVALASESDSFIRNMVATSGVAQPKGAIVPEAFGGVDGAGRSLEGTLQGAVTTTKTAISSGLGGTQAMEAGASYLAAIVKTLVADASRSADLTAGTARTYTYYVRVVGGSACSRCAILAGVRSASEAFQRHVSCQCTAAPVTESYKNGDRFATYDRSGIGSGLFDGPQEYFDSLTPEMQDKVFTHAGAQSIRDGADISKVVNARRGANGIGYSSAPHGDGTVPRPRGRFQKTTIGYRPDGTPVQVYSTVEGTTIRGQFGRAQQSETMKAVGVRYSSTSRVRLMPESINVIAGDDLALRQAFLRDAGYIEYLPSHGYDSAGKWRQEVADQRAADRKLVNRATLRFNNFTLG